MKHIKDLKIVITAGASGIGSDIAQILSQADAKVIICDKDQEALDQFSKNNPEIMTLKVDVSNEREVVSFFKAIKDHFGEINALINNAGVSGPSARLEDTNFNDWQNTLNVNLNGTFLSTKSAIPFLRSAGGGSIINIGSTSSFMGTPLRSSYSATKWGLIGLTKTWAMEYGDDNIRVNTICPSSVNGERIEQVIEREAKYRNVAPEEIKAAYLSQTSMKTFIDAEEIAGMIVYLLSPLAKKITGQMLIIDGHTENLSMINKEED
tara:strand:- start:1114 stop:1908 length:795 start_codon:yes stop_codon:yes gene_type:complete